MAAARVRAGDDQFEGPATLTVTIEVVLAETVDEALALAEEYLAASVVKMPVAKKRKL